MPLVGVAGLLHLALALLGSGAVVRARRLPAWWGQAFRWAVVVGMLPLGGVALIFAARTL
jgi:hypothetical protein